MEKRVFPRVNAKYLATLRINDDKGNTIADVPAQITDISAKGLGIRTEKKIESAQSISLEIKLSPDTPPIFTNGKLIHQSAIQGSRGYQIGVDCIAPTRDKYWDTIRKELEKVQKGCFLFEHTIFLKDTNAFGNTYFARYFEWQGMAREAYFATVGNFREILQTGTKLITKRASIEYMHESTVYDTVVTVVNNRNIKQCSFDMLFTFINRQTGKIIARGQQTLTFADHRGKLIRIPQGILDVIRQHIAD